MAYLILFQYNLYVHLSWIHLAVTNLEPKITILNQNFVMYDIVNH